MMNQANLTKLIEMLKRHEGFVPTPKPCPAGFMTIGYGHNCDAHNDLDKYKGRIISETEAHSLLLNDLAKAQQDCINFIRTFPSFSEIEQAVILDMCFNLGINGLLKFKKFLKALNLGNKKSAIREMFDSIWFSQVPKRAAELTFMIFTEEWL